LHPYNKFIKARSKLQSTIKQGRGGKRSIQETKKEEKKISSNTEEDQAKTNWLSIDQTLLGFFFSSSKTASKAHL
jgi:hypothetical protein